MKKLYSLLTILTIVFALSSCGDSKPDDLPVSIDATATKSLKLVASAGSETTLEMNFNKSDFAALEKYSKWVKKGEIQTTTFMQFSNVPEGVELTDVKLALASNSKTSLNIGNVSGDLTLKELTQLNFLQHIINEVASKNSSTVRLTFKTANTITTPIDFSVKLDAKFSL